MSGKKLALVLTDEGKKFDNVPINGKRLPLGEQTEEALLKFAIIARESNRKDYIALFKDLPKLEELKAAVTEDKIAAIEGATTGDGKVTATAAPQAAEAAQLHGELNPSKQALTATPAAETEGDKKDDKKK